MSSYSSDDTSSIDSDFITVAQQPLRDLSSGHYLLLKTVCGFLAKTAFLEHANRMSARSLASIFSPTLCIPIDILELFIDHFEVVFEEHSRSQAGSPDSKKGSHAPLSHVNILYTEHNKGQHRLYRSGYFQQMNDLLATRDITDHFATKNMSWD